MFFDNTQEKCGELMQYIDIPPSTFFSSYKTYLEDAEEIIISQVTGEELYSDLLAKYLDKENNPLSDFENKLAEAIKQAIALSAHRLRLPNIVARVDETGLIETSTDRHKAASKAAVNLILSTTSKTAEEKITRLFEILEKEVSKAQPDQLAISWASSEAYSFSHTLLVNSATVFTKHYSPLQNSRSAYRNFQDDLAYIEEIYIRPVLGEETYSTLKTEFAENTLTEANKTLLELCRPVITCFAVSEGLPLQGFGAIDSNGNPTFPTFDLSENGKGQAIQEKTLNRIVEAARKRGERYLSILQKSLEEPNPEEPATIGKAFDETQYSTLISL